MRTKTAKLYNWASEKANSKTSSFWVFCLFALEIFLFIPLDALLVFFCSQNRQKIFTYVGIAAIASTLSGCFGYLLGHFLWDLIQSFVIPYLLSPSLFNKIALHFEQYEYGAVFFGSLLPFPLKALALSAGVFHLPFAPFLYCLAAARLLRFTLIGIAMTFWGEKVKSFLDKHFHILLVAVGAKILLAIFFCWILIN